MINFIEAIEKLKDILSQELGNKRVLNKDVASALEMDYDSFRKQKSRNNTLPYYEIMHFLAKRNISINWFFFNQLPETLIDATSNYIIIKYQKSVLTSAGSGVNNYKLDETPLIIDKQLLEYINANYRHTEVIQALGDSMEPDIKDTSLLFIDRSRKELNSKSTFVIRVENELYVKKIKKRDNNYYMSSTNKYYGDIKLENFEVIGEVKGVYTKI